MPVRSAIGFDAGGGVSHYGDDLEEAARLAGPSHPGGRPTADQGITQRGHGGYSPAAGPTGVPERTEGREAMFYHLLYPLSEYWSVLNVFKYITFRSSYATVTALLICFIFGNWVIGKLERLQIGETIDSRRTGTSPEKSRHPDHGRRADPGRHRHPDPAVGRPDQPLRAAGSGGHGVDGHHRFRGRLPEGGQEAAQGHDRPLQAGRAGQLRVDPGFDPGVRRR